MNTTMKTTYPRGGVDSVTEEIIRFKTDRLLSILENPADNVGILDTRMGGDFSHRGFWLNSSFDWQIVRDSSGTIVLVPTKK